MRRRGTPTYIAPTLPSITEAAAPPSGRLIFCSQQESTERIPALGSPACGGGRSLKAPPSGVATAALFGRPQKAYLCSFQGSASFE
jgi:hypothetical protein